MKPAPKHRQAAVTLVELLVVLVILVGLGGIVAVTVGDGVTVRGADGRSRSPEEVVTLATMRTVREALVGAVTGEPSYLQDIGHLPSRLGALIENIDGEDSPYNPAMKRGWRGPYLADAGSRFAIYIESGDGFPMSPPVILDDPAILDGWGKPLVLLEPDTDYARLVSAGKNRVLEANATDPLDADRGDDLVLFLLTSDPAL